MFPIQHSSGLLRLSPGRCPPDVTLQAFYLVSGACRLSEFRLQSCTSCRHVKFDSGCCQVWFSCTAITGGQHWQLHAPCYVVISCLLMPVAGMSAHTDLPVCPAVTCRFVHGEEGLAQALKATEALRPGAATVLDAATLEAIAGDAPSCSLTAAQVTDVPLVDVMVASGMLKSKGEVR